jgi:dihydroxyacetone kinase-like predicted kinase
LVKSYFVEFVVLEPRAGASALRNWLTKSLPWARELAVVGGDGVLKVHLRTGRPDLAVAACIEYGTLRDVVESDVETYVGA